MAPNDQSRRLDDEDRASLVKTLGAGGFFSFPMEFSY